MKGNKEIMIENYPIPVSIKSTKIILEQLQKYICKILKNKGGKGTRFF